MKIDDRIKLETESVALFYIQSLLEIVMYLNDSDEVRKNIVINFRNFYRELSKNACWDYESKGQFDSEIHAIINTKYLRKVRRWIRKNT